MLKQSKVKKLHENIALSCFTLTHFLWYKWSPLESFVVTAHAQTFYLDIFRVDPVSPQVADAVEKVLNQSGALSPNEFGKEQTSGLDNSQTRDRFSYPGEEKIELQRHLSEEKSSPLGSEPRFNPPFHYPGKFDFNTFKESFGKFQIPTESLDSSHNGHHSPREAVPPYPGLPHRSSESIHTSFGRPLLSSTSEGSIPEDIKNLSSLQRSPSLSASFNDNSSSSESSFYNSAANSGKFQSYTTDPTTGLVKYTPNKEGVFFCHLCSFSGK